MQESKEKIVSRLGVWDDPVLRDGPEQMACDETLMRTAAIPVLRIFRWSRPWVSAGYFVSMNEARALRPDLPVCRRWTGGGIVVHEGDFTFSLSVPKAERLASLRPSESYLRIHAALVEALNDTGWHAKLAEDAAQAAGECFAAPVEHDVLANGSKIAGGAQRRTRHGLLHQGSVQTGKPLARNFGSFLAQRLASSVQEWAPSAGFEKEVGRLTEQKYAAEDFLEGPKLPMNFTGRRMS